MWRRCTLLSLLIASLPGIAVASEIIPKAIPVGPCWEQAGAWHHVDPWLLYAIAQTESAFDQHAVNINKDGTVDRGLMQINSSNEPLLRANGLDPLEVENDACLSTFAAAWLLHSAQERYGSKSWKAIAAYNVGNPDAPGRQQSGWDYASAVQAAYERLALRYRPAPLVPHRSRRPR